MKNILYILIIFWALPSFSQNHSEVKVEIDFEKTHQKIKCFGASDSWRCQFVGEHWPIETRKKIAELLFSLEMDKDGNPLGIGLSNWRFYLGAGSAEQGDQSDIRNVWRRSECFLDANGHYDWTKYKGQRWFLNAAKENGVPVFTAYTISPPVFYTKNGLAHATKGDLGFNLKPEYYKAYSKYLVDVIEHFEKRENIYFDFLSPFNEPQWAWDKSNQEGTPATNTELFNYVKVLSVEMASRGVKTKLLVGEAGDVGYLYQKKGKNNNGDQINAFYNPASDLYIGDFENLEYAITSHSYFTTWPLDQQILYRQKLAARIKEINPKIDYHQTEFCILEKNSEIKGGWGRDTGMATALYVARVIHSDLTIANARSWEWWTALSQFNFKDGLIHLDDGLGNGVESDTSKLNHQLMFNGNISETKLLWAFGNYSRFVRPGMTRIDVELESDLSLLDQATDLQVSAFKDASKAKVVLVFINHKEEDRLVKLDGIKWKDASIYITDKERNLDKKKVRNKELLLPKRSVSTLVIANERILKQN
ncbi:glycoside hydrolase [Saccharicrinis sp. GN24d3]|uniref:glycoside hydrolase n=1 Tax=Saccharicrinis sp. GN24d3 TaxID=3458416 RepID=UPI004035DE34